MGAPARSFRSRSIRGVVVAAVALSLGVVTTTGALGATTGKTVAVSGEGDASQLHGDIWVNRQT